MEPERQRSGRTLKKGRKRSRIPSKLVGATEAMRSRRDLEERQQPVAKVSNGGYPDWAALGSLELPMIIQYHLPWG